MGQDFSKLPFYGFHVLWDCKELDVKLQFHAFLRIDFTRHHHPDKPVSINFGRTVKPVERVKYDLVGKSALC